MIRFQFLLALLFIFAADLVQAENADGEEQITQLTVNRTPPILLKKGEAAASQKSFKPPVDIIILAKTDGPSLEISYAADKVIFNSKTAPGKLIIRGGAADHKDRPGMGQLPLNKYVAIRWLVTPKKQSIFVDGSLRFEHEGDYSSLNNPITVWAEHDAKVTVKSIKVKILPALPPGAE